MVSNQPLSRAPDASGRGRSGPRSGRGVGRGSGGGNKNTREETLNMTTLPSIQAANDREKLLQDARDVLTAVVETSKRRRAFRAVLAPESLAQSRRDFEANKKKLKTDLKKCTAFVKKVKSGSVWSMKPDDINSDIATLNLTRYLEEVVAAVLESKPKVTDIPLVVTLVAAMHQRYADFLPNLLSKLWDIVKVTKVTDAETTKNRRILVRIVTEFLASGLVTDVKHLTKTIEEASGGKDQSYVIQDGGLLVAFGKAAGVEILGIKPRSVQDAVAVLSPPMDDIATTAANATVNEGQELERELDLDWEPAVSNEVSDVFVKHLLGAYRSLSEALVRTHGKLQKLEKRCEQDRLLAGSLTEAREKGLADARKVKDNLLKMVEALADVLAQPLPHLEEEPDEMQEAGSGVEVWTRSGVDGTDDLGPFDDEETKFFYCDIPDLLTTIPPALLGMTPEQVDKRKGENMLRYGKKGDHGAVDEEDSAEVTPASEAELDAEESKMHDNDTEHKGTNIVEEDKDTPHYRLTVLLEQELPECHSRDQIDSIAERFCTNHGSTKKSRARLVRALFDVPRTRLDLLSYYSRLAASLDRVWSDIGPSLVTELEQQFHGQAKFKKNQNIESRFKTARFIGELTKFRVAPPIVFLRCLGRCLDDFTGNNIDVACCLLESSGRFMYRLPHTTGKLEGLLDMMNKISKSRSLDERSQALIRAAFYSVKPPPSAPRKGVKQYPPLEMYLRHLLIVKLEPSSPSVSFTSKQLLRLPWDDPSQNCGELVTRIMMKSCRKGRYSTIRAISAVAERIRTHRVAGEVAVRLVDAVLEELQRALENPDFRDQQRTITYARLLGELYRCNQVSGQLIIQQLYNFINVGHEIPNALREASKKWADESTVSGAEYFLSSAQLSVYNSVGGVSQTIQEDEELEGNELLTHNEESLPAPTKPVAVSEHSKYDPRVPNPTDPPNSAYRIKLVCTLLEVSVKSLVTRSNIPRLKAFLAAFQRYLFTKTMLPTDVEFSLLDTFDVIDSQWRRVAKSSGRDGKDSGFPRYLSWFEAHSAAVAFEESEALSNLKLNDSAADDKSTGGSQLDALSMNDEDDDETASHFDENGSIESTSDDEDEDRASEAEEDDSADIYSGQSDVEEEMDSDTSGADDSMEEEAFDEDEYMRQLEQDAFERELRRLTLDALEKGKNVSRKQVSDFMPSGSQFIKKKVIEQPTPAESVLTVNRAPSPMRALSGKAGISFQLIKKGNKGKIEAKEIVVPSDTNLALVASKQDDEAARERDVIKQRVLQYEAESANAEHAGGNVYLEQEKLQVIRNRPLTLEVIDKNFGTSGGGLRQPTSESHSQVSRGHAGGGRSGGRGPGPGRGRGRNTGSRGHHG